MASITLIVCDECVASGQQPPRSDVTEYTVQTITRRANLCLCPDHAQMLERLLDTHTAAVEPRGVALDYERIERLHLTMREIAERRKTA